MVGFGAGGALHQLGGGKAAAVPVNLVAQPIEQSGELAVGEGVIEVAQVGPGPGEKLCGKQVAQGISGEIADQAFAPVAVLQAALGIVGRDHAEGVLAGIVPGGGQIGHVQVALDQGPFQLKANENVQVVRDLVGLDAIEGRSDVIDGGMEVGQGNFAQGLRKGLAGAGEKILPEGQTAADQVFP